MEKKTKNRTDKYILILFLFPVLYLCLSCEGSRCAVGIIYDKYTQTPIENVKYKIAKTEQEYYSDSVGKYSVCRKLGPIIPKPNIEVEFSKEGYKTIIIKNPDNKNVYLENLQVLSLLEQNIAHCAQDDNPNLNDYEAAFLNNYIADRKDFNFHKKRILFVTGSNGGIISSKRNYFDDVKEWRKNNGKVQSSIVLLSEQEVERSEYDAIVLYWVKIFTPKAKNNVLN